MQPSLAAASILVAFALSTAACGDARARDEWARRYPASPGARLELVNVNGAIAAEATDGAEIELVARREASAGSESAARERLAELEMRETASESSVRVEVVHPTSIGRGNVEVSWTLRVPAGVDVDLRNENGHVSVRGLSGALKIRTTNGAIQGVALATQTVSAKTVNGGVELAFAQPLTGAGRVVVESVNGAVEVALPAASRVSLRASVLNGSVRAEGLELARKGTASRTRLEGTLGGGGTPLRLETTNGSALIRNASAARAPQKAEPAPSAAPAVPQHPERVADGGVSV